MSTRRKRKALGGAQDEQGNTIRERFAILKKIAPKKAGLQLFSRAAERRDPAAAATLFVYIRSDDNTYALHETFFRSRKRKRTPLEWEHYFKEVVLRGSGSNEDEPSVREGVLAGAILPGVNVRTQKLWSVRAVIGFITHHDIRSAPRPTISKRRHKAKSSRK